MADVTIDSKDFYRLLELLFDFDVKNLAHAGLMQEASKANPDSAASYILREMEQMPRSRNFLEPQYRELLSAAKQGNDVRDLLSILLKKKMNT